MESEFEHSKSKVKKRRFPSFEAMCLYEDDRIAVLNKPPYLSTLHERDLSRKSLIEIARAAGRSLSPAHRLDKETSGIIVFAKDEVSYKSLARQFEKREVTKVYHAICKGIHQFGEHIIELPILVSAKGKVKIDKQRGKPSKTVVNTIEKFRHYSLLECKPHTGRMHQIRIHLAANGAPISMDEMYGGDVPLLSKIKPKFNFPSWEQESPMMKRVALHARSISFQHPSGGMVDYEADYPKDFAVFLRLLKKYDS
jgi:23S rRNA pseudouridine955/2504/2580 synthase